MNFYLQIEKYSNRIAAVFKDAGCVKGDAVALFMPNKPEYIGVWLGLGKLGVITALINTNLRMQSLVHCLTVANVKALIYADELASGKKFLSFFSQIFFFFFLVNLLECNRTVSLTPPKIDFCDPSMRKKIGRALLNNLEPYRLKFFLYSEHRTNFTWKQTGF